MMLGICKLSSMIKFHIKTGLSQHGVETAPSLMTNPCLMSNYTKVLIDLFQKVAPVEGAKPSSPSADGEIPLSAFLFANFFFAPLVAKEKVGKHFCIF